MVRERKLAGNWQVLNSGPFEAVMIYKIPYSPSQNQRKSEFLQHFEAAGDELDRPGRFNAAYREDDRKFMRFLIPPGKRVLECWRGSAAISAISTRSAISI
jgi:hypothetical protein